MDSLNKAVELISHWKASRAKDRAAVLERLNDLVKECQTATKLWQTCVDAPGAPGDERIILSWVGPVRAKQLHDMSLRAKEHIECICQAAGPEASRFAGYDDDVVETAYRQLKPGESGIDAMKTAVSQMQQRTLHVRELIGRLHADKSTPTAKPARKKTVVAKRALKKTATEKNRAVTKSVKKKAPRPK